MASSLPGRPPFLYLETPPLCYRSFLDNSQLPPFPFFTGRAFPLSGFALPPTLETASIFTLVRAESNSGAHSFFFLLDKAKHRPFLFPPSCEDQGGTCIAGFPFPPCTSIQLQYDSFFFQSRLSHLFLRSLGCGNVPHPFLPFFFLFLEN